MQTNALPRYDDSVNTTGCCARFTPAGWDDQTLHFADKPFVRATTRSLAHVPLNMGRVFARVMENLTASKATDPGQTIVLSRDLSAWQAEHLFAVTKPVADEENITLSGTYLTKVFEGPYSAVRGWHDQMCDLVRARGSAPAEVYFFYTTCPKCAKAYGRNYVVGVARLDQSANSQPSG
jgi:hypothetical protein